MVRTMAVVGLMVLAAGCAAAPGEFEVESFALTQGLVVELAGAGGGVVSPAVGGFLGRPANQHHVGLAQQVAQLFV